MHPLGLEDNFHCNYILFKPIWSYRVLIQSLPFLIQDTYVSSPNKPTYLSIWNTNLKLTLKRYESRFELENHIKAMHSSDGKPVEYKCEDCGKVLIGRSNFKFKISPLDGACL